MPVRGELGGCGYSGALPIAPGDVDVQTLFREKNQFIASFALYEIRDETAYSPLTLCRTPSPTSAAPRRRGRFRSVRAPGKGHPVD